MTQRSSILSPRAWLASGAVAALAAAVLFLELAERLARDDVRALDIAALRWLAEHRSPALSYFFAAATYLGSWPLVSALTLCLCVAGYVQGRRQAAFTLLVAVIGVPPLIVLLKPLYARPRPSVVSHLAEVDSASFPSGHALAATIFFGTIALLAARQLGRDTHRAAVVACAASVVLLVALSRMYLGVHYPSDVLGGMLVGGTWALVVVLAGELWARR